MDNHVWKSQKWQEWQGREIISVNIDRGLAVRKRIGSGVVKAHKQKIKELEQDLRPSHSSHDVRQTECPSKTRKPKPQRLQPIDVSDETKKKKSVKNQQRKKTNCVQFGNKGIEAVRPLPPINSVAQSQTSESEKPKATYKNMVARKAIAATNLYDTRNVSRKDEILFPDLVDYGISENTSSLSTVLESPCTRQKSNSDVAKQDKDSHERLYLDFLDEYSSEKLTFRDRKKRVKASSICHNCATVEQFDIADLLCTANRGSPTLAEGTSGQDRPSPSVEAWRKCVPVSPALFGRDAKPFSNNSGSVAILKFYRDNYPLLMSNFDSTRDFPCMPIKCASPEIVQRLSHRSRTQPTLREFETTKDKDVTHERKIMRMRLDIKAIRKLLDKQRKKYFKQ